MYVFECSSVYIEFVRTCIHHNRVSIYFIQARYFLASVFVPSSKYRVSSLRFNIFFLQLFNNDLFFI